MLAHETLEAVLQERHRRGQLASPTLLNSSVLGLCLAGWILVQDTNESTTTQGKETALLILYMAYIAQPIPSQRNDLKIIDCCSPGLTVQVLSNM